MKLFILALLFTTSPAFAAITCEDLKRGPDHGYMLAFSTDLDSVLVSEQTIAGPREITRLPCEPISDTMPIKIGAPRRMAECREPNLRDAGYIVQLSNKNRTDKFSATLLEDNIAGAKRIAQFRCRN